MPFRAAVEKKLGSDMIPSLGSGSEWIKSGVSGDGGDCPDGLEVVCGLNEKDEANRMAAAIEHRVGQAKKERCKLESRVTLVIPTIWPGLVLATCRPADRPSARQLLSPRMR